MYVFDPINVFEPEVPQNFIAIRHPPSTAIEVVVVSTLIKIMG